MIHLRRHLSARFWRSQHNVHVRRLTSLSPTPTLVSRTAALVERSHVTDLLVSSSTTQQPKDASLTDNNASVGAQELIPVFQFEDAELTQPHTWYPEARALNRTIHLHIGPTNSGKTYNAVERLKAGGLGVYCGPLRLLAWQVAETLNGEGHPCSLMSGQERQIVDGARIQSCTVEMVNPLNFCHVAVIDEIQMLADPDRGWAWSRALLGLRALEVHCCGDDSVVDVIKKMCQVTGEKLVINRYERLSPLQVSAPIKDLKNVQGGDCVVAFSRKNIFNIKAYIETMTKYQCCVIYGSLPPESRKEQANMFNTNPSAVLVASDAVGMGLNLKIRRVVFSSSKKYDGKRVRSLKQTEVKQIGGRAGRHGHGSKFGRVTSVESDHTAELKKSLAATLPAASFALVLPRFEFLQHQVALKAVEPNFMSKFSHLRNDYESEATFGLFKLNRAFHECLTQLHQPQIKSMMQGTPFTFSNTKTTTALLETLMQVPLSFDVLYKLAQAPVNLNDTQCVEAFQDYANQISKYERGLMEEGETPRLFLTNVKGDTPQSHEALGEMEKLYNTLDLFVWLGMAFAHEEDEVARVVEKRRTCTVRITEGLDFLRKQSLARRREHQRTGIKVKHPEIEVVPFRRHRPKKHTGPVSRQDKSQRTLKGVSLAAVSSKGGIRQTRKFPSRKKMNTKPKPGPNRALRTIKSPKPAATKKKTKHK